MASKARLFYSDKLKTGTISRLSEKQSHYTKNVMRLKAGDKISLFNSHDGEWDVEILDQGKIFTEFKPVFIFPLEGIPSKRTKTDSKIN